MLGTESLDEEVRTAARRLSSVRVTPPLPAGSAGSTAGPSVRSKWRDVSDVGPKSKSNVGDDMSSEPSGGNSNALPPKLTRAQLMSAIRVASAEDPSIAEEMVNVFPIPRKKKIDPRPDSNSRPFGLPTKVLTSTTINGTVTQAKPNFSLQPKDAVIDHPKDLPNPTRGYDRMELDEAYKPHNIDPQIPNNPGNNDFGTQFTSTPIVTTIPKGNVPVTDANRLSVLYASLERYETMLFDPNLPDSTRSDIRFMIEKKQSEIDTLSAKTSPTIKSEFKGQSIAKMCQGGSATIDFSTNASTVETMKSLEKLQRSHNLRDEHMLAALEYFCTNTEWSEMIRNHAKSWEGLSWDHLRSEVLNTFFEDERDRELLAVHKGIESDTTIRGGLAKFGQLYMKMGGRTYTGEYLLISQFMESLGTTLFKKVNDDIKAFGDIRALSWSMFERIVQKHTNHSTRVANTGSASTKAAKREVQTKNEPNTRPTKKPRNDKHSPKNTTTTEPPAKKERAPCKKCGYNLTKRNGKWNGKHDPKECAPGQPKFGHYMKECTTCKGTNGWHAENCADAPNCEVKP